MSARIKCDDESCTAEIHGLSDGLTQRQSVELAIIHGWAARMGRLRAYHYCPAHRVAFSFAASMADVMCVRCDGSGVDGQMYCSCTASVPLSTPNRSTLAFEVSEWIMKDFIR